MGRCIMDQVTRIPLNPGPENMPTSAVFEASDIRKAGEIPILVKSPSSGMMVWIDVELNRRNIDA